MHEANIYVQAYLILSACSFGRNCVNVAVSQADLLKITAIRQHSLLQIKANIRPLLDVFFAFATSIVTDNTATRHMDIQGRFPGVLSRVFLKSIERS